MVAPAATGAPREALATASRISWGLVGGTAGRPPGLHSWMPSPVAEAVAGAVAEAVAGTVPEAVAGAVSEAVARAVAEAVASVPVHGES